MVWFKADDKLHSGSKPRVAGLPAMGLWVMAGAWSSDHLSDGRVPGWYVDTWPAGRRHAGQLVIAKLWHAPGHTCSECPTITEGWIFHDWGQANPFREQIEAERAAAAERQRRARDAAKRARSSGRSHGVTDGVTDGNVTEGEPTKNGHETVSAAQNVGHKTVTPELSTGGSAAQKTDAQAGDQEQPGNVTRDSRRESRSPRPDPTRPVPKAGQSGGGTPEPYAATEPPAAPPPPPNSTTTGTPRCTAHRHLPDDDPGPPCAGCRRARLNAEAAQAAADSAAQAAAAQAQRARLTAIRSCGLCDGDGKRFTTNRNGGLIRINCDHQPEAASA